jgi:hypothetical protein
MGTELTYATALSEIAAAVLALADARVSLALAASRFGADVCPRFINEASAEQGEMSIEDSLTRAREAIYCAALDLWAVRDGMSKLPLPAGEQADLENRLGAADRDLTALLPLVLPPGNLLAPFYEAGEESDEDTAPRLTPGNDKSARH